MTSFVACMDAQQNRTVDPCFFKMLDFDFSNILGNVIFETVNQTNHFNFPLESPSKKVRCADPFEQGWKYM